MTRRHQRRTTQVVLGGLAIASGLLATGTPATAAETIAGTGYVVTDDGLRLNTRAGPSTGSARTGSAAPGMTLKIVCQSIGQHVAGTVRSTSAWNRLYNGSYVSDAYVFRQRFTIPACSATTIPRPVVTTPAPGIGAWVLPVAAGLVSGFRTTSRPAHDGVDLGAARNTPIRAVAAGTVIRVVCNASTDNCNVDGSREITGCGWYTEIQHGGAIVTRYCHLVKRPSVEVGQTVTKGQTIGYVGSSGASSGPHLHFEVHLNAPPANHTNAVDPVRFLRAQGLTIV
jgi:murein DD-endopeptidase MepM/ murein hydrolase activator NlpD